MTQVPTEGLERFLAGAGTSTQCPEETTEAMREWQAAEADLFFKIIKPGDVVLENGCGIGRVIELIEDRRVEIVGIDLVGTLARRLALKYKGRPDLAILHADARALPFRSEVFDVVICAYNTLGNIEPPGDSRAVVEMCRVVKAGATVVGSVYSENALSAQLECYSKAGWKVVSYDHEMVRLDNGWTSRRFSKDSLHRLFGNNELAVTVRRLTGITWAVIATKAN